MEKIFEKFQFKRQLKCTSDRITLLGHVQQHSCLIVINRHGFPPAFLPDLSKLKGKQIMENGIYHSIQGYSIQPQMSKILINIIYPATEKMIAKYENRGMRTVMQTASDFAIFQNLDLPIQLDHLQWVDNIISGKKQADRIISKNQDYLIVKDMQFSIENIKAIVIFNDPKLTCLRDLRGEHLPLLQRAFQQCRQIFEKEWKRGVRLFVHYPPTFYRLHIHCEDLQLISSSSQCERSYNLSSVINNLKADRLYFMKAQIQIRIAQGHRLW